MRDNRQGFRRKPLYKVKKGTMLGYTKQKLSFVVAVLSVFAFALGNLVGTNGWYGVMKAVFGKDADATIVFNGTVPPLRYVVDYEKWATYGGNTYEHTFRQVPQSALVSLPAYDPVALAHKTGEGLAERVYAVAHLGDYTVGNDHAGSHVGIDIPTPPGNQAVAIANAKVELVRVQNYGFGNHVMIRIPNAPDPKHPGQTTSIYVTYAHLETVTVVEGQIVNKGDPIGTTGSSGDASGPHLHIQAELAAAPFHPYWLFNNADLAKAKMTFNQAVNAGLNRANGDLYTVNPMLFVQQYSSYVGTAVVAQADTHTAAVTKYMTLQERVAARRNQRESNKPAAAVVAVANPVASSAPAAHPVQPAPAPVVTPVASSAASSSAPSAPLVATAQPDAVAVPVYTAPNSTIDHLSIEHDGSFNRTWQKIVIKALDRQNNRVTSPSFSGRLYIVPTFGEAIIRPSNELTPLDFVNGVATINVLARDGAKTLIFETKSNDSALNGAVSAPMVYGN